MSAAGKNHRTTCRSGRILIWRRREGRRAAELTLNIRDAKPEDPEAACAVLRASIVELCAADHNNDPVLLERLLANKQPGIVAGWIGPLDCSVLVAAEE